MPFLRNNTFDAAIWSSVHQDYPSLPESFAPGEILVDVGCHTGALCDLAARRGATVVGYEANRENYALAAMNLAGYASVTLHHAAVWRSDLDRPAKLLFTPSADGRNTGSGSVLFASPNDHWTAFPGDRRDPPTPAASLSTHAVDAIGLDQILGSLGPVRFLKIDVEGAEFPILLTATRLDLVSAMAGEYHELTAAEMAALAPSARVGDERYTADLLRRRLVVAGFAVQLRPDQQGRGFFTAERVKMGGGRPGADDR